VFGTFKSKIVDTVQSGGSSDPAASVQSISPSPTSAPALEAANTEAPASIAAISPDTFIIGKIVCDEPVNIFGRIEGEVRGSSVNVCNGARVDGNLFAEDLVVGGSVRGTIKATRVKLLSTADVEGEICHQLLLIEEKARFEGTSTRIAKGMDLQSSAQSSVGWPLQTPETQSEVVPIASKHRALLTPTP